MTPDAVETNLSSDHGVQVRLYVEHVGSWDSMRELPRPVGVHSTFALEAMTAVLPLRSRDDPVLFYIFRLLCDMR